MTAQQLLTECATVEEHRYAEVGPLLTVDRHAQEPSLVIAIVGACSSDDVVALNRWRTSQATGVALLLDAASWAVGAEATEKAARLSAATAATENELRRNGWRVVKVRAEITYPPCGPASDYGADGSHDSVWPAPQSRAGGPMTGHARISLAAWGATVLGRCADASVLRAVPVHRSRSCAR